MLTSNNISSSRILYIGNTVLVCNAAHNTLKDDNVCFRYAPGDPPLWMEDTEKDVDDARNALEAKANDRKVDDQGYAWVRAVVWAIEGRELVIQVSLHITSKITV
jgi:hypothetical protein